MSSEPVLQERAAPLNVLFSVRPFRGHLHPLIPLARAFRRAGHRVAVASAEDVASVVTGAGLPWLPAGQNPRELYLAFPDEDPDYGYLAVRGKVADLLEIALEQFRPDVIIREPTDLAPAVAAEVVGAVNVIYGIANFIPRASWRILGADKTIAALRRDYGLPKDPGLESLYRDLYLSVLQPPFERAGRLRVPAVQRLRYTPWDGDTNFTPWKPAPAPAPSASGRPTVLVTLGTVYNYLSDLFSTFLEALGTEPIDVICTLGDGADESMLANAPANVRFERYLPHSSILPRCQAMLCHAGFNTTLGCLSAGVPLVCVPLGSDQEFNARRCASAGLGLLLSAEEVSVNAIRDAVRTVLTDPSFATKARAFADDMARRPGARATIRRVEALAAARPSPGILAAPQSRRA
jgi:UDP:flavonoid glycosyltransferase YjiC (YdhE family)